MSLLQIDNQQTWDDFNKSQPYAQFAQAWAWGEFRAYLGAPILRLALADDAGRWLAAVQLEFRLKKFGQGYWFANHGPVFSQRLNDEERRSAMSTLCAEMLKRKDLRRKTLFWRLMPLSELSKPEGFVPLSFRRAQISDPTSTDLLDLTMTQEQLLAAMHEKTRYNIRVAARHGVKVRMAESERDVGVFLDLMQETAQRDGITQHGRDYLKMTYLFLHERKLAAIRLAEFEGKILAANMEIAYGHTYTYLHGASSSVMRNVMAPYALQWDAICDAQRRGFKLYDFWGVNPPYKGMFYYRPGWEGISRFKHGFGGKQIDLVGAWDLPFNLLIYRLAFMRQFFRG